MRYISQVFSVREKHVAYVLFIYMQIVDGKPNDRNEKNDGRAPLPSVRNKWILDSDSQKDDLKQYVIEQDCNFGA